MPAPANTPLNSVHCVVPTTTQPLPTQQAPSLDVGAGVGAGVVAFGAGVGAGGASGHTIAAHVTLSP